MTDSLDLFGHESRPTQLSLFGTGEDRIRIATRRFEPEPEAIRRRLTALLEKARQASAMPWSEREVRMWQTVFPQMAGWLPDDDARQLCFDFARELERLKAAA